MKKIGTKLLSLLCVLALLAGLVPAAVAAVPMGGAEVAETASGTEASVPGGDRRSADTARLSAGEHTVWVVGDSTVSAFNDNYYYPRYGYGTQIGNYVDATYKVENKAASGRSSISYAHVAEKNSGSKETYDALMAAIQPGDILVVGFGHNDEKAEVERYTNPNGDWQTEGSFANSLWVNYVEPAQTKGAEVILCTPVVRVPAQGKTAWANSELHVTADVTNAAGTFPGGDYPAAVRKLGQDKSVAVVDLTAATKSLYETVGFEEALNFHAWTSSKIASVDKTHLNIYGAKTVAWLFANAVKDGKLTALAEHIDLTAGEPTKAADLVSNPNYKEPEYTPPTKGSTAWPRYGLFQPTAFGDIGTDKPDAKSYLMETDANGDLHMRGTGKGKIGGSADGIMMHYYAVPAGSTFSLTATATLNGFSASTGNVLPNQSGFGLMARDDMWIDKRDSSIKSDYVVAGSCANSGGPCGSFYRKNAAVTRTSLTTETVEKGKSFDLSIVYNGDGYACTFGNEPTQTGGFDFQLTSVDAEYVYVGMFATREADVTFSDIVLTVDGEVVMDTSVDTYEFAVAEDADAWTVEDGALKSIQCDFSGNTIMGNVLVATYDADGAMTGLKMVPAMKGSIPVDLPLGPGETAKVFSLGRVDQVPFSAAFAHTVPAAPAP